MKIWLRSILCAFLMTLGSWGQISYAEEINASAQTDEPLGQQVTLLESFKVRKGDTLWGYWASNERTREMYHGNWTAFLAAVSQFNAISEWRFVQPETTVHIPLPSAYMIGFSVAGATEPTVTVVLEQSKAGMGFYRLKKVASQSEVQPNGSTTKTEAMVLPNHEPIVRQDVRQIVERETVTLRNELAVQQSAITARFDQQLGWFWKLFFLSAMLVAMAVVVIFVLFIRQSRIPDDRRGIEVLAHRLVEQERLRVSAERELENEKVAHVATQKEVRESKEKLSHVRQLYDSILAETKVQMDHMAPYMYRFVVSGKWFTPPDVGKTLLVMKKEMDKKILLKPYGAADWMLVENVEPYLKSSKQARQFYGLGDPIDRHEASRA